ncbi:immunoglobulin-like domain-containing protein [Cellulomonas sp. A375-1]|uniref:immunoglobulin-like domain-containing protein n=1 Tax=Cellulomonas sp. A375-1 TaxID=1672219 RepID=UPI000B1D7FCF|nr:immunoglobulin-like domain-containing protein [Cellulomonas sp. A375-1]
MTIPRAATAALTTLALTAGTMAGFVLPASAAAPTQDLIAHYEFDETTGATVADSSGNGHDGTVVGTPTWTPAGLQLSGAPSNANYVRLPDGLLQGKAAATVSVQVKADDAANTTDNFLWSFGGASQSSGSGTGNWFVGPKNALRTTVTPSHWTGEQSATWTGNRLTPGKWQNVTATIAPNDGVATSTLKLYVDGTLVATNPAVTTSPATLADHTRNRLGGSAYDGDRGFPGTYGETRVYGTALTATEVADLVAEDGADAADKLLAGLDLGSTSAVVSDLTLPTGGLTWTTSAAGVVTAGGVVTRPAQGQPDATATLTATATVSGQVRTRTFEITVKALAAGEDPMPATSDLRSWFPLNTSYPGTPAFGTTTFVGATNTPVWTSTHVDLTGGGYIANNSAAGLGLTTSSTSSFDAYLPSNATGTVNSTLFTIGSNATTNNLSLHPFYSDGKPAAVVRIGNAVVATAQLTAPFPRDVWTHVSLVLDDTADTLTVYLDGVQAAQATGVTATAATIGTSVLRFNREGWGFSNLPAKFRDLRVYAAATPASGARALARQNAQFAFDQLMASVAIPALATKDLTLPASPSLTWTSSAPAVVSTSGVVTQPAPGQPDAQVTLTAATNRGGLALSREFDVTVPAALSAGEKVAEDAAALSVLHADSMRSITTLADAGAEFGSDITWSTSDATAVALVTDDGTVYADPQRAPYGYDARTATLTATLELDGATLDVPFDVTVPAMPRAVDDEGYAFAYFTANTVAGENIYFAASDGNNALAWDTLNNGNFVLTSQFGEKGLRDPFIIRSHEGDKFFLIATDLSIGRNGDWGRAQQSGSQYIEVWESTDLVNWSQQRHVKVSPDTAGMTWAPEAYWDDERGEYVVFWASRLFTDSTRTTCITTASGAGCYARMMYATTKDFVTFSPAQLWQDTGAARIDTTVLKDGEHYYRYTKDEGGQTGCVDIIAERSTSLTQVTTKASAEANTGWTRVASCVARNSGFNAAVEGPTVFKANPGDTSPYDYYLYLDNYGGSGYFPLGTNDLASGTWTRATGQLPGQPRHGTAMPVTLDQWQTLTGATVEQTATTSALTFSKVTRQASATVTATDGYQVGGKVTFALGAWSTTVQLTPAQGSATATATVPADLLGELTATFSGTAELAAGAPATFEVTPAQPTGLELTTLPTTSYLVGDALSLVGLAGTVTFDDGTSRTIGAADVTATGFSSTSAGTRTVTVSYTAEGATVTATYVVTVGLVPGTPTALALTTLPKTAYEIGEALSLTGLVGTVSLAGGDTVTVGANDVTATGFSSATTGRRTVTVSYTAMGVKVRATYTVTVVKAASRTTLTASATSVAHGGKVTLKAKVTSAIKPTGTVSFWSGGKRLATASLSSGSTSVKVTLKGVGTKRITAVYNGAAKVATSSSSAVTVTVRKAKATSIAVTSSTFTKGTRPQVVVRVGKLDNGAYPVGKVAIRYGDATSTVTLRASAQGVVKLTLPKSRTTAIKVKATFLPSDPANVASRTSAWKTMTPR